MPARSIRIALALLAAVAMATGARADEYPSRPIRVIVGPSSDLAARIIADRLQKSLGQPVIVENRGGGGGEVAAKAVSSAEPDGYTLLYATSAYTLNTALQSASYDFRKDFEPVALVGISSFTLLVHPSVPATDVAALVALAKAKPGEINCASAGFGTPAHLGCEIFNAMAGVRTTHVPFRDVNAAVNALLGGYVQMLFAVSSNAMPQVQSGTMRALAITTPERSGLMPNVPTLAESGYPDFIITGWGSFVAPAGTPKPVIEKLSREIVAILRDPEVKQIVEERGGMAPARVDTPERFGAFITDDIARWNKLIDLAGVSRGRSVPK